MLKEKETEMKLCFYTKRELLIKIVTTKHKIIMRNAVNFVGTHMHNNHHN